MSNSPIATPKADILVIDDTPENLALLSQILKDKGYKVRSVTKPSTGLRGAQAAPPDLILLDVKMPEMDGYEVCKRLKADQRTHDIPVIFISALGELLDKVTAFEVGGVDYITKPFQVEEVLARLETHLTICNLQKQLQAQNKQLQQEIVERTAAEEKFGVIFRYSPNPIAIATLTEGRFLDINPSFLKLTGYSQTEVIGRTIAELNPSLTPEIYDSAVQYLLENGSLHNKEYEIYTKEGQPRVVLISTELIELAGVQCTLSIINDITERKRMEDEFISLVSHELRTPMNSIIGALDLLGTQKLGTLTELGQQTINIATNNMERLIRLVNDILDLERIKSGKIAMRYIECQADKLLNEATQAMQAMADSAQVNLSVEPTSVQIHADPDRILQTLTNLLSNAIKFSEPGETVWLRSSVNCEYLQIEVQDRGRGIPQDKLQLIFERFQQVDASDSRAKGGTGLGLPICRTIVEQHNGRIWVESSLGEGSTFYVQLPLSKELGTGD
ncbi:ATP-binding protein [Mastigocoleus sp. MO_188.B34]|uniref:ATP-binding response regulator n=1 Tax=Mastigocoleus sp. MO_188.B34 TaxID=3036635 RepID=UPI00261B6ED9|nr:ATP-binding protein [Mastigocoleus sp. MO_188.B34]MDJ0694001.1 ATP-binding protein [Mastigocoleus sp. MO_188.B34]